MAFLRLLALCNAFYLVLPAGWCCYVPELALWACSKERTVITAVENCCCCGKGHTSDTDEPVRVPHDPGKICCQRSDLTPGPDTDQLPRDVEIVVPFVALDPAAVTLAFAPSHNRGEHTVSPPLHVLNCLWLC